MLHLLLLLLYPLLSSPPQLPPPGTTLVGNAGYIDKRAVTNQDWKEFLFNLGKDSATIDLSKYIPDTASFAINHLSYFNQTKYNQKPVVGVSREQIEKYCKWRSQFVSYHKNNFKKGSCTNQYWSEIQKQDSTHVYKVEYSLLVTDSLPEPSTFNRNNDVRNIGFRCKAVYKKIE